MTTDAQALAVAVRALPAEPRAALHLAISIGRTETHYGDNWDAAGQGSNNWGAVQEPNPEPGNSFPHLDHHADGTPYTGNFRVYPSADAGFKDMAFTVLKPNVVSAAESGNGFAAVQAMHANGYFELDPAKYAAATEKQYNGFLASTGEPRLLSFSAAPAPSAATDAPQASGGSNALLGFALLMTGLWLTETLGGAKK